MCSMPRRVLISAIIIEDYGMNNPKYLNIRYYIDQSSIHGKGVFAKMYFHQDQPIDIGIDYHFGIIPFVTSNFGTMINHSWNANSYLYFDNGKYYVLAKHDIQPGDEITIDYRDTPWFILGPNPNFK